MVKTLRGALSRACDVAEYALLAAEADHKRPHIAKCDVTRHNRPVTRFCYTLTP